MVDSAGGRSQVSQLVTCSVVVMVLLSLTGPLAQLPVAALAAIVLGIGVELVDVRGLRQILAVRRGEFVIALLTAAAVVGIGVEQGIILAVVASVVEHLRHSYDPATAILVRADHGHWQNVTVTPDERTTAGLVICRFPSNLYYANAHRLASDLAGFSRSMTPLSWFCLDCAGIADIDYTAAETLRRSLPPDARFVVSSIAPRVHR